MRGKKLVSNPRRDYVKVSSEVFKLKIHPTCGYLLCFLMYLPEDFNPSVGYLMKQVGCSRNTVLKYMNLLIELNILERTFEGYKGKRSEYRFKPLNEWSINE